MVSLSDCLILAAILFSISIFGMIVNRRNAIVLLMSIELLLLAVNINFIAFSYFLGNELGEIFVFFILTVAAAEAALGLALIVLLYRNKGNIDIEQLDSLKG